MPPSKLDAVILALLTLTASTHAAGAPVQESLAPGDARLESVRLTPFLARYELERIEPEGNPTALGAWELHLQRARFEDVDAWRFVYSMFAGGGTVYDRIHFANDSFAPIARRMSAPGLDLIVLHGEEGLEVTRVRAGMEPARELHALHGPRFSGGTDLVLGQLGLTPGQRVELPSTATDPPMIGMALTLDVRAIARATIEAVGRSWDCLEVETRWMMSDGQPVEGLPAMTLWVTDEAPYVVRRQAGPIRWSLTGLLETDLN